MHDEQVRIDEGIAVTERELAAVGEARFDDGEVLRHVRAPALRDGMVRILFGAEAPLPPDLREIHVHGARQERGPLDRPRAPVRVSTSCYTVYPWLPPVLDELSQAAAPIDVRIVLEATRAAVGALSSGHVDLAISSDPPARRGFDVKPLFDDEIVAVLAPAHRLAKKKRLFPADFAEERLLVYDAPLRSLHLWRAYFRPARVRPRDVAPIPITEAIVELARAGRGVGFLAKWAVHPYEARGGIVTRRLGTSGLPRRWAAVRRASDPNAAAIDAVTAAIVRAAPRPHSGPP